MKILSMEAGTIGGNKVHVDLGDRAAFWLRESSTSRQVSSEYLRPRPGGV
jgi:hypothetical protein